MSAVGRDPRRARGAGDRRLRGAQGNGARPEGNGGRPGGTRAPEREGRGGGRRDGHVLVLGGAGFIGTNVALRQVEEGRRVLVYDDLSRPGVEDNLEWLASRHPDRVDVEVADILDGGTLRRAVAGASRVVHLAGQVAVTCSLDRPVHDFESNARGTLEVLEALRGRPDPPPLLFTSTNKVYGSLSDIALRRGETRYEPEEEALRRGIGEGRPLDFHSPYGCSKGAADQYVLDYARSFGLPALVFRMSCIYGPHQHGTEDQGWVAHFLLRALEGEPVTLYGDGRQVRDILFVDDLVDAMEAALSRAPALRGRAFNIGGGPERSVSLVELIERLEGRLPRPVPVSFDEWRTGDQRWYVSDTAALREATGWRPRVPVEEGLDRLGRWLARHRLGLPAGTGQSRRTFLAGAG